MNKSGNHSTLASTPNETMGVPSKVGNDWIFAMESRNKENIYKINDKTSGVSRGYKVPAEYANASVDGFIAYANPLRLYDPNGNKIYDFDNSKIAGITSGMAKLGKYYIIAVMDGAAPGIASTKGWVLRGSYPEVAVLNGKLYGFARNGEVHLIDEEKGTVKKTIGNTGNKAQRARTGNGVIYWSTANWDQLWVMNGDDMKRLAEWKDGDKGDGTTSGSLFNTSITLDGDNVIFGRSIDNRGIEIYKVELK